MSVDFLLPALGTTRPVPDSGPTAAATSSVESGLLVPWEPRVLVLDDDERSRRTVQGRLQELGLQVDVAADQPAALDLSARWPYAAVFMDCRRPAVEGSRTVRELRSRDGASQHALIVGVTSHPRSICLAVGMDDHIAKPVHADDLDVDCSRLGLLAPAIEEPAANSGRSIPAEVVISESNPGRVENVGRFLRRARRQLPELWRAINAEDRPALTRVAGECRHRGEAAGALHVAELFEQLLAASDRRRFNVAAEIEHEVREALVETAAGIASQPAGRPDAPGLAGPVA
jgi:CheY-like chemotaxis protein